MNQLELFPIEDKVYETFILYGKPVATQEAEVQGNTLFSTHYRCYTCNEVFLSIHRHRGDYTPGRHNYSDGLYCHKCGLAQDLSRATIYNQRVGWKLPLPILIADLFNLPNSRFWRTT